MARIIDLEFNDKKYSIEFDRMSILKLFEAKKENDSDIEAVINLIYFGLVKHHKDDMPNREEIVGWVMSLGDDMKKFAEALQESVQEVLDVIQNDQKSKNLKWGVRK